MTLNLTVTTADRIYQCADYRLVDPKSRKAISVEDRKLVLVNAFNWSATVCYTGVATTPAGVLVGDWLNDLAHTISLEDPLDALLDGLRGADEWLAKYPLEDRRICFSVGAFEIDKPVFALVSNFSDLSGVERDEVSTELTIQRVRPTKPRVYVNGVRAVVTRAERRRLERLAARRPEPPVMYDALASVTGRVAAAVPEWVSAECFTSHLSRTGEGGGRPHGVVRSQVGDLSAFPPALESTIRDLVEKQFPQGATLAGVSFVRAPADLRHHQTLLEEKPDDADVHNNFGAFLLDMQDDAVGAEREYLKAIELDPLHTNALGNLANVRWRDGRTDEAEGLYQEALGTDNAHENVVWNYVRFRRAEFADIKSTEVLLDAAIEAHTHSARLLILRAENRLRSTPAAAVADLERARQLGGEQAVVEPLYAFAIQLAGRPLSDCVAAYRTAVTVQPDNAASHLNLSQLLFHMGNEQEAKRELLTALQKGLDPSAELEAVLYSVAHLSANPLEAVERVRELCASGARLDWDVSMTLATVESTNAERAAGLGDLVRVMRGELGLDALESIGQALSI